MNYACKALEQQINDDDNWIHFFVPSPWQAKDFLEPDYELGKEGGQGVTQKVLILKVKKESNRK